MLGRPKPLLHDDAVLMTVFVRVLKASTGEVWSKLPVPRTARNDASDTPFDARSAIALLTSSPLDVAIYVIPWNAPSARVPPLFANSALLSARSSHFKSALAGGFKQDIPEVMRRPDDEDEWPDSDAEGDESPPPPTSKTPIARRETRTPEKSKAVA